MTDERSTCHNSEVNDGKCTICGNETGAASVQTPAATVEDDKKLVPGDVCTLPDGTEGIVAPDGVCVPRATEEQMPKVGDACEVEGKKGTLQTAEDGSLVCVLNDAQ